MDSIKNKLKSIIKMEKLERKKKKKQKMIGIDNDSLGDDTRGVRRWGKIRIYFASRIC